MKIKIQSKVSLLNSKVKFKIQVPHFYLRFKWKIRIRKIKKSGHWTLWNGYGRWTNQSLWE